MKVIDETVLRAANLPAGTKEYLAPHGAYVTPLAREYLAARGIALSFCPAASPQKKTMTVKSVPKKGPDRYIDAATGERYLLKPEHMTHLRDNLLVPKTHPRVEFRGRLDSLEAKIMELQIHAEKAGRPGLYHDLNEALLYVREILSAEVREEPLAECRLFGMDASELRRVSHDIKGEFGFEHPVPDARMGELPVYLNTLRTQVRECELSAARAFGSGREDILRALNRLSSGIYILFCRELAGYYR
jgi:ethanolamine utilization cobalamin adenosyltransferase